MSDVCETYPNEGPLWPCGCLLGDPNCRCGGEVGEVRCVHCDELIRRTIEIRCPGCGCPWDGD